MRIEVDSVEEFVKVAQQLGMMPAGNLQIAAQQLAKQMLEQAGFKVNVEGTVEVPTKVSTPAEGVVVLQTDAPIIEQQKQEVLPPAKTTRGKRDKLEPLKADEPKAGEDILGQNVETPANETKPLTKDDAVAAMRNLAAKKNVEVCRALLAKYEAHKASQVPEDKIAAFVAEANQRADAV